MLITAPDPRNNQSKVQRILAVKSVTGKVKLGPKMGVEIRFYKRPEWERLKDEEKAKVIEHCHNNKNGTKKRKSHGVSDQQKKISALESKLEQQVNIIASLRKRGREGEETKLPPVPKYPGYQTTWMMK